MGVFGDSRTALLVHSRPSAALTANAVSPDLATSGLRYVSVEINVTALAGTAPSLTVVLERRVGDLYFPIWTSPTITAVGKTSASVGPGMPVPELVGAIARLRYVVAGTSVTFSVGMQGI